MTRSTEDPSFWARDPLVLDRGGILPPDRLSELERLNWEILTGLVDQAFDTLRGSELASELVGLEVHLIDSPAINAFVRVVGPHKIIGLNRGLIDQLWSVLATLMAHPHVLQEHFQDAPTVDLDQWHRDLQTQLVSLRQKRVQPAQIPAYITEARLETTTLLYCCMLDYIIHHELAHVVRGHAPLLSRSHATLAVEEIPREPQGGELRQMLNLIEIDADLHGLDIMLQYEREFDELRTATATAPQRRNHMFLQTFPVLLLQQLFDLEHLPVGSQLSHPHPPPIYRAIIYTRALSDTYELTVGLEKEAAVDEHDKAWWEASRCALLLGFPEGRWVGHMGDIDFPAVWECQRRYQKFEEMLNRVNTAEE